MPTVPASDYAKEPVIVLDKTDTLSVGDKVRINNFYLTFYCGAQSLVDLDAEIVKIVSRPIKAASLDKDNRAMFVGKYGTKDTYDIIGLWVRYPNDARVYVVSPFGYDKVA